MKVKASFAAIFQPDAFIDSIFIQSLPPKLTQTITVACLKLKFVTGVMYVERILPAFVCVCVCECGKMGFHAHTGFRVDDQRRSCM